MFLLDATITVNSMAFKHIFCISVRWYDICCFESGKTEIAFTAQGAATMKIISNKFIDNAKQDESLPPISGKEVGYSSLELGTTTKEQKHGNEVVVDIKDADFKKFKTLCYNRHGHFGIQRTSCISHANLSFFETQVSVVIENRGITDNDFSTNSELWQKTTGKTLQIISRSLTILGDLNARVPSEIKISVDYSSNGIENSESFFKELTNLYSQSNTQNIIEKFKSAASNDMYINKLISKE